MASRTDVTQLLNAYSDGDREALDRLTHLLYDQLSQIAHARLRNERSNHTLNTTGLVHEAYLKIVDVDQVKWQSRAHLFSMASNMMRRILINYAKMRKAEKRSGGALHESLEEERLLTEASAERLLEMDDALKQFGKEYPRAAHAVEYRYFGGFTTEETADALGVSVSTVERDLRFAQAWLSCQWRGNLPP